MSIQILPGSHLTLGVTKTELLTNFALFSKHATQVFLHLYKISEKTPFFEVPLKKTNTTWHIALKNLPSAFEYSYSCDGPFNPKKGSLFNSAAKLIDPYAKDLSSNSHFRARFTEEKPFDWERDSRPMIPMEETIIYEMHVRSFTQDTSSGVNHPGTFLGILEKIPHLKSLGINAIELMPIHAFNKTLSNMVNPNTREKLCNYWGYATLNFFTPMKWFGSNEDLKTLVKALHLEGIEVILDVVYNHTSEEGDQNIYHSFRGIDNSSYYIFDENGYHNYSGCGNTLNCNAEATANLILDSLRYFVLEYHIDGFRFDLASILTRGDDGTPLKKPPLIEKITRDPILAATKLIAEPWDAGGLYQLGTFPSWRFSEWNDKYRNAARRFFSGKGGKEELKKRILGSPDLFEHQGPSKSINFITAHDGFTLRDLCSYSQKHNLENGEDNRDGANDNESWNSGVEGETDDPTILKLRERQMKNMILMLLTSQGTPMLLMGDEYGHTRKGNNNAWCQDNNLNYFLWNELKKNKGMHRFFCKMIHFRKDNPCLREKYFLKKSDITWHCPKQEGVIAYSLKNKLLIAFNATSQPFELQVPNSRYQRLIDTSCPSPEDFLKKPISISRVYSINPHSAIILKN